MVESMTFFAIVMAFMLAAWVCCRIRQVDSPRKVHCWGAVYPTAESPLFSHSVRCTCSISATRRALRRNTEPADEAPAGAYMEQIDWYTLQQEARARAGLPRGTGASSWFGAPTTDREQRRSFLEQALLRQKYSAETKAGTETAPVDEEEAGGDNSKACAICLDEYAEGDDVCASFNRRCKHVFHRSCIIDWLMSDDTCPCCRQNFIAFHDVEGCQGDSAGLDPGEGAQGGVEAAATAEASSANSSRFPASVISSGWESVALSSIFLGSSRHSSVGAIEQGVECDPSNEANGAGRSVGR